MWYPQDKKQLNEMLDEFLNQKSDVDIRNLKTNKKINGVIVPHAGYIYSGKVAGKAYSLLKGKRMKKIIILAPSHYAAFSGVLSGAQLSTPLGILKIMKNNFEKNNLIIQKEHSLDVQLPFIQKLFPKAEILPLVVGNISQNEAEKLAKKLSKITDNKTLFIISSDLSHFFPYDEAVKKDRQSIKIIENLDIKSIEKLDACGLFPLMIFFYLAKIKSWHPVLVEYKNSGDVTGEGSSVVGYSSFVF